MVTSRGQQRTFCVPCSPLQCGSTEPVQGSPGEELSGMKTASAAVSEAGQEGKMKMMKDDHHLA